jgi:hypothetical protein
VRSQTNATFVSAVFLIRSTRSAIPDDMKSIKELKADLLTSSVLKCLKVVDKDRDYPRQVPKNTIQKVNFATQLVNRIMARENGHMCQPRASFHPRGYGHILIFVFLRSFFKDSSFSAASLTQFLLGAWVSGRAQLSPTALPKRGRHSKDSDVVPR